MDFDRRGAGRCRGDVRPVVRDLALVSLGNRSVSTWQIFWASLGLGLLRLDTYPEPSL